jgi:glucose-6-phosphate dehydrogenase assembly protein OpcA
VTATTAPRPVRTDWSGRGVTVAQVADQLARQRRPADGGAPLSLAGVLNLVAYAPGREDLELMQGVIERLADHQPSRAILLVQSEEGEGIDAAITTSCRAAGDDTTIAVELVVLTLHGTARAGDASAVLPLLRPELPTMLWWPAPPADDPAGPLARLAALADRVITEAGRSDAAAAVSCLARWADGDGPAVTDLAWAAITPWRQLLAQILDPTSLERLRAADVLASIVHPAPRPTVEALLLAGWLRDVIGSHVTVELHPRPGPDQPLLAVELEGSVARRRLSIERLAGRGAAVCVTEPSGASRRRVLPLPSPDRATLMAGELELQRRDRAFERAVALAARVVP